MWDSFRGESAYAPGWARRSDHGHLPPPPPHPHGDRTLCADAAGAQGGIPILKAMRFVTIDDRLLAQVTKRCPGIDVHPQHRCTGGKYAKGLDVYPEELADSIIRWLQEDFQRCSRRGCFFEDELFDAPGRRAVKRRSHQQTTTCTPYITSTLIVARRSGTTPRRRGVTHALKHMTAYTIQKHDPVRAKLNDLVPREITRAQVAYDHPHTGTAQQPCARTATRCGLKHTSSRLFSTRGSVTTSPAASPSTSTGMRHRIRGGAAKTAKVTNSPQMVCPHYHSDGSPTRAQFRGSTTTWARTAWKLLSPAYTSAMDTAHKNSWFALWLSSVRPLPPSLRRTG